MKRLEMKTIDGVQENLSKIARLFPTVITESTDERGNIVKAVDFEKLKQELSTVVATGKETYEFRWVGKDNAIAEANAPTNKTLRPCNDGNESKNWDKTENLYIEGDNLEVLKILKKSYKNKVKMIYIDPPYNTGNDSFIYPDDYKTNKDQYDKKTGAVDENGCRIFKNTETNGRFHSRWCSMMYPRLKLARDLLTDDGVIFISIDDNEFYNLVKICDEVFGEVNFVALMPWRKRTSKSDVPFGVSQDYEWVICYAKSDKFSAGIKFERKYYTSPDYPNDRWRLSDLTTQKIESQRPNSAFDLIDPKTSKVYKYNPKRLWGITRDTFQDYYDKGKIIFPDDYAFLNISMPAYRVFESEDKQKALLKYGKDFSRKAMSTVIPFDTGMSEDGNKECASLLGNNIFTFPKPSSLIKYFLNSSTEDDAIILDFFSGSATTAHAVMQLNAEDGGNRKFIMVQLPEICDEKSEAYKAGYKNICEIGKERIRRAGEKIKNENPSVEDLDIGFRVFKLDSGNYEQVFKAPVDLKQSDLGNAVETIKGDRTDEDLLFGVLLAWGVDTCLSLSYDVVSVGKYKIYVVKNKNGAIPELIACFDADVDDDVIRKMAEYKPLRVVFRERSLKTVERRTNAENLLKHLHPHLEENDIRLI